MSTRVEGSGNWPGVLVVFLSLISVCPLLVCSSSLKLYGMLGDRGVQGYPLPLSLRKLFKIGGLIGMRSVKFSF